MFRDLHVFFSLQILAVAGKLGLTDIWTDLEENHDTENYFGGESGIRIDDTAEMIQGLENNTQFGNGQILKGRPTLFLLYR